MAEETTRSVSYDIGLDAGLSIRVVPITKIQLASASMSINGSKCAIHAAGKCQNLPDKQKGELKFSVRVSGQTGAQVASLPVQLKVQSGSGLVAFEIMNPQGNPLSVDPIELGLVGKGAVDLSLSVDFPESPEGALANAFGFDLPFDIGLLPDFDKVIGGTCKIIPSMHQSFKDCHLKVILRESDESEPEDPRSQGDEKNYHAEFRWPASQRDPQRWRIGCGPENSCDLAYANEAEKGDFEFSIEAALSRDGKNFRSVWIKSNALIVPKPKLEEFNLEVFKINWWYRKIMGRIPGSYPPEFPIGDTPHPPEAAHPKYLYQFKVSGRMSGFARDLELPVDVRLIRATEDACLGEVVFVNASSHLDAGGRFSWAILECAPEVLGPLITPDDVYHAALRISKSAVSTGDVPFQCVFAAGASQMAYLSLSGAEKYTPDAPCRVLSAGVKLDGTKMPVRALLVSHEELQEIIPLATPEAIARILLPLNEAFEEFGISTRLRAAHFLCHVPIETGNLTAFMEKGNPGAYRGRGILQITGQANYLAFTNFIKQPELMDHPDPIGERMDLCCRASGWWWKYAWGQDMSLRADKHEFIYIVGKVNPLFNGKDARWAALRRAYATFNLDASGEHVAKMRTEANAIGQKLS